MTKGKAILPPRYIPAEILRKLTRDQLKIIQTQKNTKGRYSQNADRAQKILWQTNGHTTMSTGRDGLPLNMYEKGWEVPTEETVDLEPWLNGTEVK